MRVIVQRVKEAAVRVGEIETGRIGQGLLLYIGVGQRDGEGDVHWLAEKIPHLRIFPDADDKSNLSLLDIGGEMLVVSQFTLYGDCRKGRRPGFSDAAPPELANRLYEKLIEEWRKAGLTVATGLFQREMLVSSVNWGPATYLLETMTGNA